LMVLLADYTRAKTALIILDNCEHLIEGCAQFADAILRAAPQVKILASSREALSIGGEATYRVPSLAAPDPQRVPSLEVLTQYDAVRLFIERARAVMPSFEVNNTNAPAVAQLCYHLDGIPLALELAAARVRGLKVEQIAQRLDDRFRLLTGGGRTALPRQQTLRATIDWSHSLLTEQERILFCRLSVFAGGSTIEAAEAVCSGHGIESSEVLDLLLHLVDKSLILMDEQNAETRYHLSETIREYARDKLWEVSESQELRDRQLEFFSRLAEKVEPKLKGAEQLACLNQLELDLDNFRAALDWSLEEGDAELGIRLAGALWRFWVRRGYWSEGYERLKRALTRKSSTSTAARAKALGRAGDLAIKHRDIAAAHNLLMESLALSHELGDEGGAAFALYAFGLLARYQGDLVKQRSFFEESLSLYRKLDDRWGVALVLDFLSMAVMQSDPSAARLLREECLALIRKLSDYWGLMRVLTNSGELARFEGDYARAKALYEEAAVFGRELGAARWELANQQHGLGWVTLREGDNGRAAEHFKESILLQKEHGVITGLMAACVAGLGGVAAARGQFVRAAQLLGAVGAELTAREANGVHMELQDRVEIDRCVAEIRAQPDTAAFHAAWEAGQKMTLDEAIAYALEESGG
jgi:predicted ATPase